MPFLLINGPVGSASAASVSGQGTWQTTLLPRDLDGDSSTVEAYYDIVLDITWLADANFASTSAFDADGLMNFAAATDWVTSLNPYGGGITGWRLPTMMDTGAGGCPGIAYSGTDCGYNVQTGSAATTVYSEMASMFYDTLGNLAEYDPEGNPMQPGGGLTNSGPFANLMSNHAYWTNKDYQGNPTGIAWYFYFRDGYQFHAGKTASLFAWAVHPGDVGGPVSDTDGDGVADAVDNCTDVANPSQCDSDNDGYGNRCDGDFGNPAPGNGTTNAQDYALFRVQLGQPSVAPTYNAADLNCNGVVNAQDYALFRGLLGSPPGPSGLHP